MRLRAALDRFRRDETASVTVEAVIMLPILFWVFIICYVFFDAFRAQSLNVKASYTISDALSRETDYITPEYVSFLYELQGVLTDAPGERRMRLSVISYDKASNQHVVRWSEARGGAVRLPQGPRPLMAAIPIMADQDITIMFEGWVTYHPPFAMSRLGDLTFYDVLTTRPRFAPKLCWNWLNSGGTAATEIC